MTHQIKGRDLHWRGDVLHSGGKRLIGIEADATYPGMWRVRRPDGSLTDMCNRTRAKDAAEVIILAHLNGADAGGERSPMRPNNKADMSAISKAA